MKTKDKFCFLSGILFAVSLLLLSPICAEGVIYKYTDKNGTVNFTDCFECIPKEYRDQIQRLQEVPAPKPAGEPPAEEGKRETEQSLSKEQAGQSKEAEPMRRDAEEKAASEKAEQERKLQARQEKEKRIAELSQQIAAKEQEIKNLRTNWMVYDRANLYRLSGEIEDLRKEIQSIQDTLATDQ